MTTRLLIDLITVKIGFEQVQEEEAARTAMQTAL